MLKGYNPKLKKKNSYFYFKSSEYTPTHQHFLLLNHNRTPRVKTGMENLSSHFATNPRFARKAYQLIIAGLPLSLLYDLNESLI